jgi:S1-C subfamily serine protease
MKNAPLLRIGGLVLLALTVLGAVWYVEQVPPDRLAALMGFSVSISDESPRPTPSPSVSIVPVSEQVPALSGGTVVVETFSRTQRIRAGSGTVVSSDGLVLTTAAAAPYGSGGYVYQVAASDGRLVRARRVAADGASGLVLLKADGLDRATVPFEEAPVVRAGDELTIIGASLVQSRYVPVVISAGVVHAADAKSAALSLDRSYVALLAGARVVARDGKTLGILLPRAVAGITDGSVVNAFIRRYLETLQPTP